MVVTTLTANAAARESDALPSPWSFWSAVPFFGVSVLPESLPSALLSFCAVLAFVRLWSALVFESSPLLSDLAPSAAASASVVVAERPEATKLTGPPVCRLRDRCASTVWLTTASASDRPIPAEEPTVVLPLAVVTTDPAKVALTSALPVSVVSGPVLSAATDDSFAIDTATEGVTVTVPPAPPASVSFVSESLLLALRTRSRAPTTGGPVEGLAPGSKPANTSLLMRFRAIEAPMPTVPLPLCDALALVVFEPDPAAVMATSPVPVIVMPG